MLGVQADRREAVAERERKKLVQRLASLGIETADGKPEDGTSQKEGTDDSAARSSLLRGTLPNTGQVLDLIDSLAGDGTHWAHSANHGLRGSVSSFRPRLGRKIDQTTGTPQKPEWIDDGSYECLCPLALASSRDVELTEGDLEEIHGAPLEAARAQAAAAGAKGSPERFNEGNAAWGLLVAVSYGVAMNEWAKDNLEAATDATLRQAERTHQALHRYALARLQPADAETIEYDAVD